jgi:hypothetical protein
VATDALPDPRRRARVPNPVGAAAPLFALAVLGLLLEAAPDLPWAVGVGVAGLFVGAGLARLAQQWLVVRKLRRIADQLILRGSGRGTAPSSLVAWRTSELTSTGHRRAVADEATRLVHELDAASLPGAVPLNRVAARPFRDELGLLAATLAGDASVTARGVLLAERLLTSPRSPLYDRNSAERLGAELRRVRGALAP